MEIRLEPWIDKNGKPSTACGACTTGFTMHVNKPDRVFQGMSIEGGGSVLDAGGRQIMTEPVEIGRQNGCPIYANGVVVIARENVPVWVPVTVREFDEALIRKHEKAGAEAAAAVGTSPSGAHGLTEQPPSLPRRSVP